MQVRRLGLLAVLLVIAGALSAGCSGGQDEPALPTATSQTILRETPTTPPTVQLEPTPTKVVETPTVISAIATAVPATLVPVEPTATSNPDARQGGTLQLATQETFAHQDVHDEASPALSTWGPGLVYSRMLRLRTGPDVLLPSLALECDLCIGWRMTDELTFEFDLRSDVRWQDLEPLDGRPLTARDVVFSYDRQREAGRPNASLLQSVESIEEIGDLSVRIRLRVADADFLTALADARSKIVAPEAVAQSGDLRNGPSVGTGPWLLSSIGTGGSSTFVRNPDYFEPSLPYADGLRIQVVPDSQARLAGFVTEILDFYGADPSEWTEVLTQRPNAPGLHIPQPGAGLELAMNASTAPFDDTSIRRAAFLAMDPWQTISDVWGDQGFVSLGSPVAEEPWLLNRSQLTPFFGKPDDAMELLSDVPPVTFTIKVGDFGSEYLAHAQTAVDELLSAGFVPEMEVVNRRVFGDDVWTGGNYQMFIGPIAPVTMPNSYLLSVLHSRGPLNSGGIRNPEMDQLIEAQASEYDSTERRDLFHQIQMLAFDNAYRFMPATQVSVWGWSPRVRDFYPNFGGFEYHHWARVWLTEGD